MMRAGNGRIRGFLVSQLPDKGRIVWGLIVDLRSVRLQGSSRICYRGKNTVINNNMLSCLYCLGLCFSDENRYAVSDVSNLVRSHRVVWGFILIANSPTVGER